MMNIKERIEWLEKNIFYLDMKDGWSREDFETSRKWREELRELEKKVGDE